MQHIAKISCFYLFFAMRCIFHQLRTVQYYTDLQHLSPYYFSTFTKAKSGKSAMQWIENVTMTFIQQLLENSDKSIKEKAAISIIGMDSRAEHGCQLHSIFGKS